MTKTELNYKLDVWFDLFMETEGFEDDILRPLHDRLRTKIFKFNENTKTWDWTGKNLRLTLTEKDRLGYFNESLKSCDFEGRRTRILKFYNLLWD